MAEIRFTPTLAIDEREIEWSAIRAQGPGGQNVNKVANTALLRFDDGWRIVVKAYHAFTPAAVPRS
mgnify:CR=1 FL=1